MRSWHHFRPSAICSPTMIDDQVLGALLAAGRRSCAIRRRSDHGQPYPARSQLLMPDGGMQKMSAALLAAVALNPLRQACAAGTAGGTERANLTRHRYRRNRSVAMDESSGNDGFPTFAAERPFSTHPPGARGELELTLLISSTVKGLPVSFPFKSQSWQCRKSASFVLLIACTVCSVRKEPASDPPQAVKLLTVGDVAGSWPIALDWWYSSLQWAGFETAGCQPSFMWTWEIATLADGFLAELDVRPEQLRLNELGRRSLALRSHVWIRLIFPFGVHSWSIPFVVVHSVRNSLCRSQILQPERRCFEADGLRSGVESPATASTTRRQISNWAGRRTAPERDQQVPFVLRYSASACVLKMAHRLPVVLCSSRCYSCAQSSTRVCRSSIAEGTGSEGCLTRSSDASYSALVLSEKAGQAAVFVYDVTGKKVHRREVQFQSEARRRQRSRCGRPEARRDGSRGWRELADRTSNKSPTQATTQLAGR